MPFRSWKRRLKGLEPFAILTSLRGDCVPLKKSLPPNHVRLTPDLGKRSRRAFRSLAAFGHFSSKDSLESACATQVLSPHTA